MSNTDDELDKLLDEQDEKTKQAILKNYRHIDDIRGAIPEKMISLNFSTCESHRADLQNGKQCFCDEVAESYNRAVDQLRQALNIGDRDE